MILQSISLSFILISVILTSIVVCTFIGNFFVIVAILIDKNLQTAANQLVLSLALADLMVACLVMPLGAYNDLQEGWFLGTQICEFWTSADVLCCTGESLGEESRVHKIRSLTNANFIFSSLYIESSSHSNRPILGSDKHRLYLQTHSKTRRIDDTLRLDCGSHRLTGPNIWLERSQLFSTCDGRTQMSREPGCFLSNICDYINILRASRPLAGSLLAHISGEFT